MRIFKHLSTFILIALFSICFLSCNSDPCEEFSCQNSGICIEGVCSCPGGFSGTNCEIENICYDITCVDGTCDCPPGYSGVDCSFDSCTVKVCENGGTCLNGLCDCATGYEGTLCATKYSDKFIGNFTVIETCITADTISWLDAYPCFLFASTTDPTVLNIRNMKGANLTHLANIQESDPKTFIIPEQTVFTYMISGTGVINATSDTITVTLVNDIPGNDEVCELTFIRI